MNQRDDKTLDAMRDDLAALHAEVAEMRRLVAALTAALRDDKGNVFTQLSDIRNRR